MEGWQGPKPRRMTLGLPSGRGRVPDLRPHRPAEQGWCSDANNDHCTIRRDTTGTSLETTTTVDPVYAANVHYWQHALSGRNIRRGLIHVLIFQGL